MFGRWAHSLDPSVFTQPTRLFSWSVLIQGPEGCRDPACGVAEVGGLHGAVVIVTAVDLRVAVVEAAAGVVVHAVDDPVLPFRLVVDRSALRVVDAETHSRLDEDAVDLVAHDRDRRHVREGQVVEAAHRRSAESAARRLDQVVVLGRLVVHLADPAVRVRAERVLRRGIGVAARIVARRGTRTGQP